MVCLGLTTNRSSAVNVWTVAAVCLVGGFCEEQVAQLMNRVANVVFGDRSENKKWPEDGIEPDNAK